MNILSLFDGMSCGQIALREAGVPYHTYYASEIDKHAIKVTQHNFHETVQLGDVTKWREWDIDWSNIGLVLAGSPCQGFSFSGKGLAFDDPRSALFFTFVEIWRHVQKHNPNAYYLLENVKMKKEHELVISRYMNVMPIEINSALVSAQNRVRLYWTNIANEPYGLFGDMKCTIEQPKDKGILLRDVLEIEVDDKYYLSDKMIKNLFHSSSGKNGCFEPATPKQPNQKANCMTARQHKISKQDNYIVASRGRNPENPNLVITHSTQPRMGKGQGGKGHLFKTVQKSYCLDTGNSQAVEISQNIRRLTPIECQRLQSVPEWYDMTVISDTQRYRCLGNGWTVAVIVHILKHMVPNVQK